MPNNSKMVYGRTMRTMADQKRRQFQWYWSTPIPDLKVTPLFNTKYLRNGRPIRDSDIVSTKTYTRFLRVQFKWPLVWVTLSKLAKYSITRSIVRSLCDSWANCWDKARYWSKMSIFIPLFHLPTSIFLNNGDDDELAPISLSNFSPKF